MIIAFFLKTLCDISYYMCFASFIGSVFGIQPVLLPYVLLLSLCAAFSMALDSRTKLSSLRIVPIALGAAGILLAADILTLLVLLPAIIYTALICLKRYFYPDHYHYVASFKPLITVLGIMTVVVILFGKSGVLQAYAGPFIVLYILGSVLLMRMLRHSERTMKQPAFILMNIASITGVCILSLLMSTNTGINIIKTIFLAAYKVILAPLAFLFSYVISTIIGIIYYFFIWLMSLIPDVNRIEGSNAQQGPKEQLEDSLQNLSLNKYFYIIVAICLTILLIYIFIKLLDKSKNEHKKGENTPRSYYEYIKTPKKQLSFSALLPSTPAGQVRLYYRKMLMFFIRHGLAIKTNMDTSEIEAYVCRFKPEKKDLIKKMRLIYQPARYGKGVSKQAAAEAKSLYHEIKKTSKDKSF